MVAARRRPVATRRHTTRTHRQSVSTRSPAGREPCAPLIRPTIENERQGPHSNAWLDVGLIGNSRGGARHSKQQPSRRCYATSSGGSWVVAELVKLVGRTIWSIEACGRARFVLRVVAVQPSAPRLMINQENARDQLATSVRGRTCRYDMRNCRHADELI